MTGRTFSHYEVLEKLGEGGMGVVYKARDTRLGRSVALKFVKAQFSDRFEREARAIAALNHPHIATLYEVGEHEGSPYLVMEYVEGQPLKGPRPVKEAIEFGIQIADALAAAHAAGIVHRDLKPANILVTDKGSVKILDFGLAKLHEQADGQAPGVTTVTGAIMGTPGHMSPEQAKGESVDQRTDVWSLGVVLYEMLSGRLPFRGDSAMSFLYSILNEEPTPLKDLRPDLPPELVRVVSHALMKDLKTRYSSAAEFARDLRKYQETLTAARLSVLTTRTLLRALRKPRVAVAVLLCLGLLGGAAGWFLHRQSGIRWTREVAVPEITRLADQGKFGAAYSLAVKAEKSISSDPVLAKLWPVVSHQLSLETTPPGVDVYRRDYVDASAPWELVGRTPLKNVRQPLGMFVWKFEKQGFGTVLRTTSALGGTVTLDETARTPLGMVRVSPGNYPTTLNIPGYEGMPKLALQDYWIDRYEVTNRHFKVFVDRGGYQNREYWKVDFEQNGKRLSWDEATALFRDAAGRPGPKDWIQGEYPKGQDDFPVTGISWYEAAAYAEFAGRSLPTIYHWNRAAGSSSSAFIVPASNFGGSGVLPAGSKQDVSPWGNYDMAGNVKEWIWTQAESGRRYVLGGAWDEPNYMFIEADAQSPFLRAANIGFRCVKYIQPESIPKAAIDPVPSSRRDFTKEKPASDELFQVYRSLYSYDKTPLNASAEPFGKDEEDWKAEKIGYTAGYGNERAIAYLFLPKKAKPPFQTVVFFPGSNALLFRTFSLYTRNSLDAILKSGRAVLCPVYKSTWERGDGLESDMPNVTSAWRDHVMMWVKDTSRAIDYAETRPELDHNRVAYYGYSWGAMMGAIVPAMEQRIKVCVLASGGFYVQRSLPEVDGVNFAPHVEQPVLMLNGRYDYFFPVESSQEPFYRLLGSRKDQKKHLVYETGHNIPRNELIKETLNWLDQYLGPVK